MLSTLRVTARVDETERGRLAPNQSVTVQLNAIPDRQFTGTHRRRSAPLPAWTFPAAGPFRAISPLRSCSIRPIPRFKPGISGQVTVVVDRVPDAITIPAQAMFQKSGQNVAYVWRGRNSTSAMLRWPGEVATRSWLPRDCGPENKSPCEIQRRRNDATGDETAKNNRVGGGSW